MTAPVTAIIAYDLLFFEKLPRLFPHAPVLSLPKIQSGVRRQLCSRQPSSSLLRSIMFCLSCFKPAAHRSILLLLRRATSGFGLATSVYILTNHSYAARK
jgi:hypothetical protein